MKARNLIFLGKAVNEIVAQCYQDIHCLFLESGGEVSKGSLIFFSSCCLIIGLALYSCARGRSDNSRGSLVAVCMASWPCTSGGRLGFFQFRVPFLEPNTKHAHNDLLLILLFLLNFRVPLE